MYAQMLLIRSPVLYHDGVSVVQNRQIDVEPIAEYGSFVNVVFLPDNLGVLLYRTRLGWLFPKMRCVDRMTL
jgi:hypothetical protein